MGLEVRELLARCKIIKRKEESGMINDKSPWGRRRGGGVEGSSRKQTADESEAADDRLNVTNDSHGERKLASF